MTVHFLLPSSARRSKIVVILKAALISWDEGKNVKSTEIEMEIATLQQRSDHLKERLDYLIQRFQAELPNAAESWIRKEVKRQIEDCPETVGGLDVERLGSFNAKVGALAASLPDIAKKETSDAAVWPHYRTPDTYGYGAGKDEPFFTRAFRGVVSHLGAILDEFGFLKNQKGVSWARTPDGFRYAIDPMFDFGSALSVNEYERAYREFRSVAENIEMKQNELAKAKAKELWKSA